MQRTLFSGLLVAAVYLAGCATIVPDVHIQQFGEADPLRDAHRVDVAAGFQSTLPVRVLRGEIPEGILLFEDGRRIAIAPGYENVYQVIGTVEANYTRQYEEVALNNLYWTWDYDEGWRKGLCYPQVPLKVVTMGIWNLVPTNYPCSVRTPDESRDREAGLIEGLKRGAHAMGANLVILTHSGDYLTIVGNLLTANIRNLDNAMFKGFAIRVSQTPRVIEQSL